MRTIVIDARELRTSTGRYVERLLYYLQEVDTKHQYIVLLKPKDTDGWEPSNKNFRKIACRAKEFTFAEQWLMAWQLYRLRPNLVHFAMTQQPVLYLGKTITTMHDLTTLRFANPAKNKVIFSIKQWVYERVIKWVAYKSKRILTPTEFVKDDIAKFTRTNSRKIVVTYEAGDQVDVEPEPYEALGGKDFIMYIGRATPHKNLSLLVDAFALLKQKHPGLQLVFVGKKDVLYKRLRREAKHKEIENVLFTDYIPDSQMRWLLEHCKAYVFPSLSEGFGLPGLEAMASGAPVVSSNATCLPEVYGDAAHYFDPLNVEEMAEKINDVLVDSQLRDKLIAAGKKQVAKYSWKRMAEETLDVYKQVLREE